MMPCETVIKLVFWMEQSYGVEYGEEALQIQHRVIFIKIAFTHNSELVRTTNNIWKNYIYGKIHKIII